MTTINHGAALGSARPAVRPGDPGEMPWCPVCNTDQFLIFEEFIPARQPDAGNFLSASAGYSCSECGSFNAHAVPSTWRPPHWFWYS